MAKKKKLKILLGGSYHSANLGDLALLDTYIKELRKLYPESRITVLSNNPKFIREKYGDVVDSAYWVINAFRTAFEVLRNDVLILGGGGLLFDYSLTDTLKLVGKSQILHWLLVSFYAKFFGRRVFWSGLGIGPITTKFSRFLLKNIAPAIDSITVRDRKSFELLNKIAKKSLPNLRLTSDIVWTWRENPPFECSEEKENKIILIPRSWGEELDKKIVTKFANIVHKLDKPDHEFVILPTNLKKDRELCISLFRKLKPDSIVRFDSERTLTLKQVVREISTAQLVVSMRMHGLIFGSILGTPGIGISYKTPKIISLDKLLIGVKSFPLKVNSTKFAEWGNTFIKNSVVYKEQLLEKTIKLSKLAKENLIEIKEIIAKPFSSRFKKVTRSIIQIFISGLLFYLISRSISIPDTLKIIRNADISLILFALGLRILAIYPTSSIWRRTLYLLMGNPPNFTIRDRWNAFILYVRSYFFDNFGVGSLGGDVYRALQISKTKGAVLSAGSVIFEKASGLAMLLWIAASMYLQKFILKYEGAELSVALLGTGLLVVPAFMTWIFTTMNWLNNKLGSKIQKIKILKQVSELNMNPTYKVSFQINIRVIAFYLLSALAFSLTSRSVGTILNYQDSLFVFSLLLSISALPISFQGVGVRDATLAGLLLVVGKSADTAVAISSILLLQKVMISLTGGVVYLFGRKKD